MAGSDKPYYQETWFEYAFLAGCFLLGYLLFKALMPPLRVDGDIIQTLAMARLFAEGRWLDAFAQFNQPPIYPILLAIVIKIRHSMDLRLLVDGFYLLNFILYMMSVGLTYYFVRRQIHKPYIFAITALYALSPLTFNMLWSLDSQMTYMAFSMAALLAIDISISQNSAMGSDLSRKEFSICGSLLGVSILTRQIGYTLLIAFFCILIKRLGLKKSISTLSMLMLFLSPFVGRDLFGALRRPDPFVSPTLSAIRDIGHYGLINVVRTYADRSVSTIAAHTVGNLDLRTFDEVVESRPSPSAPSSIDIAKKSWGRWLLAVIAITGAVYGLYQYTGVGSVYLCVYTITSLVLLPQYGLSLGLVLPLLLFSLYYGITRTAHWFKPLHFSSEKVLGPTLTVWILLCSFSAHLASLHGGRPLFSSPSSAQTPHLMYFNVAHKPSNRLEEAQTETSHRRASEWLRRHLRPMKIAGLPKSKPSATDEKTSTVTPAVPASENTSNFDYLVEESDNKLPPEHPGAVPTASHGLRLVYEDAPGKIRIWRINPEKSAN